MSEKEDIKKEFNDFLGELNNSNRIDYATYSELFDNANILFDKMFDAGKKKENTDVICSLLRKQTISAKMREDIRIIKELGDKRVDDIVQILEAIPKTVFTVDTNNGKEKKITEKKAREILGDKYFLAGMQRSAFHRTACVCAPENGIEIYFDSSEFFK